MAYGRSTVTAATWGRHQMSRTTTLSLSRRATYYLEQWFLIQSKSTRAKQLRAEVECLTHRRDTDGAPLLPLLVPVPVREHGTGHSDPP